jgi:hypothetical protein
LFLWKQICDGEFEVRNETEKVKKDKNKRGVCGGGVGSVTEMSEKRKDMNLERGGKISITSWCGGNKKKK